VKVLNRESGLPSTLTSTRLENLDVSIEKNENGMQKI